jgi:V-type H+-transporting ATPase subunit a
MSIGVLTRLEDIKTVLNETTEHRRRTLVQSAENICVWMKQVQKMKAIFHTLNLLNIDVTQKCLIGECWVPTKDLSHVRHALHTGDVSKGCARAPARTQSNGGASVPSMLNVMETDEPPPTFFRTNKFTKGFQNIVDSYGIAKYGEVNPGACANTTTNVKHIQPLGR